MKKRILALLMATTMVMSVAGCGNDSQATGSGTIEVNDNATATEAQASADSDSAYVTGKGTLVVGVTDFEPMDYKDENGNWVGFDADLATEFAKSLGVDVKFIEIDWDNKIMELNGKTVDCIWNGMTLTEEVTSSMDCSNAYCNNAQVVVVDASVAENYMTSDSLKELTFAVEAGSAGEEQAVSYELTYVPVESQANALMEVAAGTSSAAIIDSLMAAAMVGEGTSYSNLTYTIGLNDEKYGVGFRQGSDLPAKLNDFLKASYEDGTMNAIAEKYGVQAAVIEQ